jgi:hypothetical protein
MKPTFWQFLVSCRTRYGKEGDLARECMQDRCLNRRGLTTTAFLMHLVNEHDAPKEALAAAIESVAEYEEITVAPQRMA